MAYTPRLKTQLTQVRVIGNGGEWGKVDSNASCKDVRVETLHKRCVNQAAASCDP
jgi:hypothetical protein